MATQSYIVFLCVAVFTLVRYGWCKDCNNFLSGPPQSHTLRAALEFSGNDTWKAEMHRLYDHLIPSEDVAWNSLLAPRRSNLEAHEEEEEEDSTSSRTISVKEQFDWTMMYRRMRHGMEVDALHGQSFLQQVSLHNVRLDPDSIHGIAQHTILEYLLLLDVDRLVYNFRKTAGLTAPSQAYGGWEVPTSELRGHFVGHYMSASAMLWASTHNDTLKEKMTAVVSALGECQKAMGTGYLSAFPSEEFNRLEALIPVWAPYYTIHKIMAGLLDQYTFAGNTEAYNMTVWMAEYFYDRVQNVITQYTIERHWESLNDEFGGMNDVLYRLYSLSGDADGPCLTEPPGYIRNLTGSLGNPKHMELAHLFDKPCFLGLLALQEDNIATFHANTHIPEVIGAQMRYEVLGDTLYKDIATSFMDIINSSHSYATGGTSVREHWVDPKRLATQLETENEETCTTYNMLKVARHLFKWTKEMAYADYYERALTNGILPIQRDTEPGVMIYMLPLGAGVSKALSYHGWGTKYDSFWCCYGTASESFSKLGDSIYFQEKGSSNLYIIQFIASILTWDSVGLTLKQAVQQLSSLDPNLHVSLEFSALKDAKADNEATVNIRIPFWTTEHASALLNGEKLSLPYSGNFLAVQRKWESGDNVSLSFPVSLRIEQIKDDRPQYESIKAIMFGPYLLAGMSDGDWDIQLEKTSSISDWITPVPASYGSQLFTFSQEGKVSSVSESNNTLVFKYRNNQILMDPFPMWGTKDAAHATFRIVDSASPDSESRSVMDFVGKNVYFEPFVRPGVWVVHQGIDNNVTVSYRDDVSLETRYHCSLRSCGALSARNSAAIFTVRMGLDGSNSSLSFESINLPSCFLYGGTTYQAGQAVRLQCMPKSRDFDFNHAVSFTANTGLTTYHPISFIARGLKKSYLLEPLLAYKDESYTAYFNITT